MSHLLSNFLGEPFTSKFFFYKYSFLSLHQMHSVMCSCLCLQNWKKWSSLNMRPIFISRYSLTIVANQIFSMTSSSMFIEHISQLSFLQIAFKSRTNDFKNTNCLAMYSQEDTSGLASSLNYLLGSLITIFRSFCSFTVFLLFSSSFFFSSCFLSYIFFLFNKLLQCLYFNRNSQLLSVKSSLSNTLVMFWTIHSLQKNKKQFFTDSVQKYQEQSVFFNIFSTFYSFALILPSSLRSYILSLMATKLATIELKFPLNQTVPKTSSMTGSMKATQFTSMIILKPIISVRSEKLMIKMSKYIWEEKQNFSNQRQKYCMLLFWAKESLTHLIFLRLNLNLLNSQHLNISRLNLVQKKWIPTAITKTSKGAKHTIIVNVLVISSQVRSKSWQTKLYLIVRRRSIIRNGRVKIEAKRSEIKLEQNIDFSYLDSIATAVTSDLKLPMSRQNFEDQEFVASLAFKQWQVWRQSHQESISKAKQSTFSVKSLTKQKSMVSHRLMPPMTMMSRKGCKVVRTADKQSNYLTRQWRYKTMVSLWMRGQPTMMNVIFWPSEKLIWGQYSRSNINVQPRMHETKYFLWLFMLFTMKLCLSEPYPPSSPVCPLCRLGLGIFFSSRSSSRIIFVYSALRTLKDWEIPVLSKKYPAKRMLSPTLPAQEFQLLSKELLSKLTEIAAKLVLELMRKKKERKLELMRKAKQKPLLIGNKISRAIEVKCRSHFAMAHMSLKSNSRIEKATEYMQKQVIVDFPQATKVSKFDRYQTSRTKRASPYLRLASEVQTSVILMALRLALTIYSFWMSVMLAILKCSTNLLGTSSLRLKQVEYWSGMRLLQYYSAMLIKLVSVSRLSRDPEIMLGLMKQNKVFAVFCHQTCFFVFFMFSSSSTHLVSICLSTHSNVWLQNHDQELLQILPTFVGSKSSLIHGLMTSSKNIRLDVLNQHMLKQGSQLRSRDFFSCSFQQVSKKGSQSYETGRFQKLLSSTISFLYFSLMRLKGSIQSLIFSLSMRIPQ